MRALLVLIVVLLCTSCVEGQHSFKNISKQDLQKILNEKSTVQLIDVRTQGEYNRGSIKGAVLIDYWGDGFLTKVIEQFDKSKPIYLYCKVGGRSSKAAQLLVENGFKTVYSLDGGYSNWTKD